MSKVLAHEPPVIDDRNTLAYEQASVEKANEVRAWYVAWQHAWLDLFGGMPCMQPGSPIWRTTTRIARSMSLLPDEGEMYRWLKIWTGLEPCDTFRTPQEEQDEMPF